MRKKNRILAALLAVCLGAMLLAGCAGSPSSTHSASSAAPAAPAGDADPPAGQTLRVVATIFPVYDWARQVVGDLPGVELVWLQDTGVDLHSYQPSASDLLTLSSCDLFLYVGGESDSWVESALAEAVNPNQQTLNLLDVLGDKALPEELTEGMQPEEDHEGHDHDHEDEEAPDEHIWLSLRNASLLTGALADALGRLDPDNADAYAANAAAYQAQLAGLDAEYQAAVEGASASALLFGDRFPFRYLADDYGLEVYAAFPGCSAETEASFETVAFLADKVDQLGLPAVLTIEGSDQRVAQTIIQNTAAKNAALLRLDSMQGTTARDAADGASYLSIMESNLAVLKTALA